MFGSCCRCTRTYKSLCVGAKIFTTCIWSQVIWLTETANTTTPASQNLWLRCTITQLTHVSLLLWLFDVGLALLLYKKKIPNLKRFTLILLGERDKWEQYLLNTFVVFIFWLFDDCVENKRLINVVYEHFP